MFSRKTAICKRQFASQGQHNLRECTSWPPPSANKAAHSGFETQRRRHQKCKTGVSVAPQGGHVSTKFFFKKDIIN